MGKSGCSAGRRVIRSSLRGNPFPTVSPIRSQRRMLPRLDLVERFNVLAEACMIRFFADESNMKPPALSQRRRISHYLAPLVLAGLLFTHPQISAAFAPNAPKFVEGGGSIC